jgi:hypothetical protein
MSERQLLALLRFHNPTEAWWHEGSYLAALLAVEAHVLADDDESEAAAERALLALHLVIECALAAPVPLPDYTPHYADLLMLLQDYDLPTPTLAALFSFCEQAGDLARSENIIHELLVRDSDGWWAAARAFYLRLQACSDEVLAAAGLSREEVIAGLAGLDGRG